MKDTRFAGRRDLLRWGRLIAGMICYFAFALMLQESSLITEYFGVTTGIALATTVLPGYTSGRTISPREIFFGSPPDARNFKPGGVILDATYTADGGNTGYTNEIRAGWALGKITSSGLYRLCTRSQTNGVGRASSSLIVDNAAAFKVGDSITIGGNQVFTIGKVKDSDNAASTGVALYLHVDELSESPYGHLEAVNAGNADSSFTLLSGAVVKVEDDDAAATGGVAIYFDEDAANPDERLLAAVPTGKDAFILASDGSALRIKYHATPSTPGVQVYFDDDGATVSERCLFVSPTNADGFYHTDDIVIPNPGTPGTPNYPTRSTGNVITAISGNTITLTSAATWADGDAVICEDGSDVCRGFNGDFVKLRDVWNENDQDKPAQLVISGQLNKAMLLGDVDAIIATKSLHDLSGIQIWSNNARVV